MIVRVEQHKTVPDIAVVTAGPELAHDMGRFAFARWQPQHKAFWVEHKHLATLRRELERQGHTVIDDRHQAAEEKFSGPLPECRSCGTPASRKASMALNRCPACGDAWHPIVYEVPGVTAAPRIACTHCGRRQMPGFPFCGECGSRMPDLPAPAARPVDLVVPGRPANQDPIPLAQTIAELDLANHEEEPQRERYP